MPASETPRTPRKQSHRYDIPGHAHYLTFSCYRRQPFFAGRRAVGWFLDSLSQARGHVGFDLWAYVVMPEHVHLLVRPHNGSTVGAILWAVKRPVTRRALAWVDEHAPEFAERMAQRRPGGRVIRRFWQAGGGYDRNLWTPAEIREKVHYIHENPVRRRLVPNPQDWAWSSWRAWELGTDEPVSVDRDTLRGLV